MNTPINDGGPAFPVNPHPNIHGGADGMSLRDWFAGQALANGNIEDHSGPEWADRVAEQAYRIADAMIKAREAKQ